MTAWVMPDLHALYETSRWRRRAAAFKRLQPMCANGCGRRSEVVDHIVPRSTARSAVELQRLTWDTSNWQALAKVCHDAKTRREQGYRSRVPVDARPAPVVATAIVTRDYSRRVA